MITKPNYLKKSIGTTLLLTLILSLVLVVSGRASALFTFIGGDLTFTATVAQVDATSLTVDKGGTLPFVIVTDGTTQYSGAYASLGDVSVTDKVLIQAREHQGMLLAEEVQPVAPDTYGYGNACEAFQGSQLWVSAIEDGELWLSRANVTFMVAYDNNTQVMPGEQSVQDLTVGETIAITGEDCHGDGIVADTIMRNALPPTDDQVSCEQFTGLVFDNSTVLLSHDEGGAYSPYMDVDVPAGTYNVYGVSFDNHSENAWDTLTNESWFIEAMAEDELVYTSNPTDDLPDGVDRNATMIGSEVVLEAGLDQVRFVHNAFVDPTYQSILPECVVFTPVEVEDDLEEIIDDTPAEDLPTIIEDD